VKSMEKRMEELKESTSTGTKRKNSVSLSGGEDHNQLNEMSSGRKRKEG